MFELTKDPTRTDILEDLGELIAFMQTSTGDYSDTVWVLRATYNEILAHRDAILELKADLEKERNKNRVEPVKYERRTWYHGSPTVVEREPYVPSTPLTGGSGLAHLMSEYSDEEGA